MTPFFFFVFLKCNLCRFCAFTWNALGMRWCTRSRLAAMFPSPWRASTCSLSWRKTVLLKSPHTTCCQSFVTTALQEVWDTIISCRYECSQTRKDCHACFCSFRWSLHCLLSECDQRPVVWVWWPVCDRGPWDGCAERRSLCVVLQVSVWKPHRS